MRRGRKGKSTEEGDAADGVIGLADTGAGEVVVDEALRAKTAEQALNDAVFKVKVNHTLIYMGGGLKNDRADGACGAPLVEILILWLRAREASPSRGTMRGHESRGIASGQGRPSTAGSR